MSKRIRNKIHALAMIAAISASNEGFKDLPKEETEETKSFKHQKRVANLKKRGVKEFVFNGHKVYARNEENAYRKAVNKGFINPNNL